MNIRMEYIKNYELFYFKTLILQFFIESLILLKLDTNIYTKLIKMIFKINS